MTLRVASGAARNAGLGRHGGHGALKTGSGPATCTGQAGGVKRAQQTQHAEYAEYGAHTKGKGRVMHAQQRCSSCIAEHHSATGGSEFHATAKH